jgi:hypothetical protein
MVRRFSVGSSLAVVTKAAAVAAAVALIGTGVAGADDAKKKWKVKITSNSFEAKVDVYDVIAGKFIAKDADASNGLTVEAQTTKGLITSDPNALRTRIRWTQKHEGNCWEGGVCSTKDGVEVRLDPRPMDWSKKICDIKNPPLPPCKD